MRRGSDPGPGAAAREVDVDEESDVASVEAKL